MMEGPIIIETQLTFADIRAFFNFTVWIKQKAVMTFLIMCAGLGVLMMGQGGIWIALGSVLVLCLIWYVYTRYNAWKNFRAAAESETGKHYHISINTQATSVDIKEDGSQKKYQHDTLLEVCEAGHYFYLYQDQFTAIILPKRDIPPEMIPTLKALFKYCFGDRFKPNRLG